MKVLLAIGLILASVSTGQGSGRALKLQITSNGKSVEFETEAGISYQPQWNDALDGFWVDYGQPVQATGEVTSVEFPEGTYFRMLRFDEPVFKYGWKYYRQACRFPVWGLSGEQTYHVANERPYGWFYTQSNTGRSGAVNCVPAAATMVARWYYPDFPYTVEDARDWSTALGLLTVNQ